MPKDTIIIGGLAGIIGNVFKELLTWGLYFTGLIKYTFVHFCAGIVVFPARYIKDPFSIIIGILIDYTLAVFFSLMLYFVMKKIGTDHWVLKGIGFGMLVFLTCYAVLRPTFSIIIESPPLIVLMYMIPNWVYGVITSWFIKKFGTYYKVN